MWDLGAQHGSVHWDVRGPVTFVDGDPPKLSFAVMRGTATARVGGQTITTPADTTPFDVPLEVGDFC